MDHGCGCSVCVARGTKIYEMQTRLDEAEQEIRDLRPASLNSDLKLGIDRGLCTAADLLATLLDTPEEPSISCPACGSDMGWPPRRILNADATRKVFCSDPFHHTPTEEG